MALASQSSADGDQALFALPQTLAERRGDGSIILKSPVALESYARCVGDWLEDWARRQPEKIFLAERADPAAPWTTITYGAALQKVRSIASWVLAQGMSAERPLVILSDNSIAHALLALAAMHVGVPVAAISPAYSLMSKDFDKLKGMISVREPGGIYVSDASTFAPALAAIMPLHAAKVLAGDTRGIDGVIPFAAVAATAITGDVEAAFARLGPDTIAKFLFTSGSTGSPKAVINTQRMLTSNQAAKAQTWSFLDNTAEDLVILDWLPWSHTFG